MHVELLQHLEKEEVDLFPMLGRGGTPSVVDPIGVMRTEHDEHAVRLQHLMALTRNAMPPEDACTTWQQLCAGARESAGDLQQHIRIENGVLFPQFEPRRSSRRALAKKFPLDPARLERVCRGCDRYCPADAMGSGNGSVATLHPAELSGEDCLTRMPSGEAASPCVEPPDLSSGPKGFFLARHFHSIVNSEVQLIGKTRDLAAW